MAISPTTQYPANTTTPDADYPYGGAVNESASGALDGTPLEEDWVNDLWGMIQYFLAQSETVPSGVPDTALTSQIAQAMRSVISKPDWTWGTPVGTPLSLSGDNCDGIARINSTDICFLEDGPTGLNGELRTYRFNGTTFQLIGNPFDTTIYSGYSQIVGMGANRIVMASYDSSTLRVYDFDGTDWSLTGTPYAFGGVPVYRFITALTATTVAIADASADTLQVYQFNGATWSTVGSALALPADNNYAVAALNETDIAFNSATGKVLERWRFDGADWAQFGNGLALNSASIGPASMRMAALNSTDIIGWHAATTDFHVYRWDIVDAIWVEVGEATDGGGTQVDAFITINGTDIVKFNESSDVLSVLRLGYQLGDQPHTP